MRTKVFVRTLLSSLRVLGGCFLFVHFVFFVVKSKTAVYSSSIRSLQGINMNIYTILCAKRNKLLESLTARTFCSKFLLLSARFVVKIYIHKVSANLRR
jgi:hypothetical protein